MSRGSMAGATATICVAVLFSSGLSLASAQEGGTYRVAFEHDGRRVTGFALYAQPPQGEAIRVDLGLIAADRKGLRIAAVPRLPDGAYTLSVAAYNSSGESPRVATTPSNVKVAGGKIVTASAPAVTTEATAPVVPAATAPPKSPEPKSEKKGGLRRLWGAVVGEDN
jgi:hypothetical protein